MTKIRLNTQNIQTIQNDLDLLAGKLQEAITYANQNVVIPNGFRRDDIVNAIKTLESNKNFVYKTSKWIAQLKQKFQTLTDEHHIKLQKLDDINLIENELIVK